MLRLGVDNLSAALCKGSIIILASGSHRHSVGVLIHGDHTTSPFIALLVVFRAAAHDNLYALGFAANHHLDVCLCYSNNNNNVGVQL